MPQCILDHIMWHETAALAYWFDDPRSSESDVVRSRVVRPAPSSVPLEDDDTLVARLRMGDEGVFNAMYRAHAPALWRFAARLTRSRDEAEELVHDVFAAVWEQRATWEVRHSIKTYLYGAVRNRVTDTRRRHATAVAALASDRAAVAEPSHLPPAMGHGPARPDTAAESAEIAAAIRGAIATLPERRRTAFTLRHLDDMSYAEIGAILGVTEKAAFILVARTREALRPLFERFTGEGR
jgi:RNA polymerase sigma-70 factor (ECF subfamily)